MNNLCRAKTLDTQEWIYGAAVVCGDRSFIVPPNALIFMHNGENYVITGIPVDGNTICHFLKKVNGVDFFEGDIIYDRILKMEGVVCYDTRTARFVCRSKAGAFFIPYDLQWKGTIYDNLEIDTIPATEE